MREHFENRLLKMQRHLGKWARRQGITCYRVYDNDLPEFPFAVDLYEDIVHISEYARNHGMEPDEHAEWLAECLETVSRVFDIPLNRIYLKFRQRQKGLQQYERFNRIGTEYIVRENGLRFYINPADYLDTGLFLDHRNTRQLVREVAAGKRMLNLFAYTGAFSVYAAAGAAASTTTVDLSNTYLTWADRNLTINGFTGPEHQLLQADVLAWLREPTAERWDLAVVDPPTFSNSKRMDDVLDVQRDHVWILNRVLARMAPGGTIYFSTNFRKFKLDTEALQARSIRDITRQTIPEDFRNKKIHQCFVLEV
ncbi:MAG: class I SAM-dependent methyltransferase [Saprospiraceae bacterium]|nr:class I SAM-dependent methyltransferase [Saprospiraceae bacterium]